MKRKIYVLVYTSPLFPAHTGLFIPTLAFSASETVHRNVSFGKVIHVTGDAHSGFTLEFKRNYILEKTGRPYKLIELAEVEVDDKGEGVPVIADVVGDGLFSIDQEARDLLEKRASMITPPKKSLRSVLVPAGMQRVQIKNCQTWLRELIVALVEDNILPRSAIAVLENSPKN